MIGFNVPPYVGDELEYVKKAIENHKICGDGEFTRKSSELIEKKFDISKILLTTSCTAALEMAALLLEVNEGDEIIMPSYTFVSTANAFVLRGAKIVFVDIRKDTMNIDENLIEDAITSKTKAIVVVHYAGVACEMNTIMDIAHKHNIKVVEDSAQGVMAKYGDKYLGNIGDIGCYSFHETKNYSMGEGGAITLKDNTYVEKAEIIREKGTDRSRFFRGQVDKYTWVDCGSSYLPSDINSAYLYGELLKAEEINNNRLDTWNYYYKELEILENDGLIERPYIPEMCTHNAHMFYIKVKDIKERTTLIDYLKNHGVQAVFHYVPLHSSLGGKKFGRFNGADVYTTKESERLLRLPMYYNLSKEDRECVKNSVLSYFKMSTSKRRSL